MSISELKFLLTDDSKVIRNMLKAALTEMGAKNIKEASSGEEALEALRHDMYDVVILDVMMTGMTGLQTLEKIRTTQWPNRNVHVFMVTGEAKKEYIQQAAKLGVKGYVVKPFTLEDISKRIGTTLEKLYPAKT